MRPLSKRPPCLCYFCGRPAWWHLQNEKWRGDDGHVFLLPSTVRDEINKQKSRKGLYRWHSSKKKKTKVKTKRDPKRGERKFGLSLLKTSKKNST